MSSKASESIYIEKGWAYGSAFWDASHHDGLRFFIA